MYDKKYIVLLHHLVELLESYFLLVQSYGSLEGSSELDVDGTLYEVVNSLALLEKLISIVLNILIRNVGHAILSELHASHLNSSSLNVSVLNLDVLSLNELLLDEMPLELLDALLVVLLYEVLALVLVVKEHDTLEECVRPCQLANLVLAVLAYVDHELVVSVLLELRLESLGNLVAEFLFALYLALAEYLVVEFLTELSLSEALNLSDLVAEVRLESLGNLAVDLEK